MMPGCLLLASYNTSVFFSDDSFLEMMLWGLFIFFLVVILLILKRFLRSQISSKVKHSDLPFGMSPGDLDAMKETGQLTEEELKAVRRTLAKKIVERTREKEEAEKRAPRAEEELAKLEGKVPEEVVEDLRQEVSHQQGEEEEGHAPRQKEPEEQPTPPKPQRRLVPEEAPTSELPPHLHQFINKNDIDLEDLQTAGFLSQEDIQRIRQAREQF